MGINQTRPQTGSSQIVILYRFNIHGTLTLVEISKKIQIRGLHWYPILEPRSVLSICDFDGLGTLGPETISKKCGWACNYLYLTGGCMNLECTVYSNKE